MEVTKITYNKNSQLFLSKHLCEIPQQQWKNADLISRLFISITQIPVYDMANKSIKC